jgi:hypothetical protein
MEYGYLLAAFLGFVGGLAGAVLVSWSSLRRLLALEEGFKVINFATEARIKELERRYLSDEKREASKARWSGNAKKIEEAADNVLKIVGATGADQPGHPWDPRTWGKP